MGRFSAFGGGCSTAGGVSCKYRSLTRTGVSCSQFYGTCSGTGGGRYTFVGHLHRFGGGCSTVGCGACEFGDNCCRFCGMCSTTGGFISTFGDGCQGFAGGSYSKM